MIRISLPTDNLYKFKAIAGLALVIVSLVTAVSMLLSSRNSNYKVEAGIAAAKAETLYYKSKERAVNKEADLILKAKIKDEFYKKESSNVLDEYHKIQNMQLDVLRKLASLSAINSINGERLHSDIPIYIYLIILTIFGYYLSFSGFSSWYKLHQKYQDKIIKLQYLQIRRDSRRYHK